jgi:excisionase family DNA binding protein
MRVTAVRKLPGHTKARLTQHEQDLLEIQAGTFIDDAFAAELNRLLRGFWSANTYLRRPHTYKQAADVLHVSTKWLQRRVRLRQIPFTRVGSYVRFTGEDIEQIRNYMHRSHASLAEETGAAFGHVQQFTPIPANSDNGYDADGELRQSHKPENAGLN